MESPRTLGVVGAGTMGSGIAQLGVGAGMRTHLHDPIPEALEKGVERARAGLRRWAERGREVDEGLLAAAPSLDELSGCEFIIEAAPEQLELKRELFGRLSEDRPGRGSGEQYLLDPGHLVGERRRQAGERGGNALLQPRRR